MSVLLQVENVTKHYAGSVKGQTIRAVDGVTFELEHNEIFACIGESGSGKSTLAELIVGLQQPTSGTLTWLDDARAPHMSKPTSQPQLVFQNPDRSMNPYWRIRDIVTEPMRLGGCPKRQAYAEAEQLLAKVKLSADLLGRYPHECSGGQKQRIAIARALSVSPKLLIADEITSALDPSTEAEILQLLLSLKQSEGMSILYITHRLETISGFADRVAVMKNGAILEMGETDSVLADPQSAYTIELLRAVQYS
ncbi:oligopeptide transport system ATP-binding protein [Paenibacillus cellulosilyticus]|uniref:Oligopeptide transport system ATP-binding protein n=1 Tax=Paenibacillus cellulosilyticus TaxID=375489 RepID=A0A2V2YW05_9BACL|nr:dipeptide/oligopeptide/nickel ABC transporter ATP-binding protein [Paenibacillus cellulosilyticus]PWW05151.1 oligopeptide transport system ATP-binding protein [Paenibacillus cellulosilyticus]